MRVESISISDFKARCLAILQRVKRTGQAIRVTRFGKPVADVVPPAIGPARPGWLGSMAGTGEIVGDIVSPASAPEDWEAIRD